ncbi:unnamed protein product [Mucor hiemalis]
MLVKAIFGLLALSLKAVLSEDIDVPTNTDAAAVVSSVMYAPVPTPLTRGFMVTTPEFTSNNEPKFACHNYRTEFSKNTRGWQVENSMQDTYDLDNNGMKLNLVPPKEYRRMRDTVTDLPYNQYGGRGPTLNSTTYMRYGRLSAHIRSAGTGGAVTAFILMADGGDEIDFEFLGGDLDHVQSNYFWGKTVEYTVNGGLHKVTGGSVDTTFHKYTIDWQPDKIQWFVDDVVVRTRIKAETCDGNGVCKFPSQPARIQFGLWDGSVESGTAEWSRGPINWGVPQDISAHIKDVTVDCNPEYNQIVN